MGQRESQLPAPLTAEDLGAYISSQDDFAFEREVYHKANGLGFSTDHAGLYEDPVTNKARQYDIRASKTVNDQRICLTIECKGLSASYPLLVSCVPRSLAESFHEVLYTDTVQGVGGSYTRVALKKRLHRAGDPVGKSMRQVRRDHRGELTSGDEVFDKWMQALASAADLIRDAADQLSAPASGKPRYVAVLPVLVVSDETLWVADYASNGRLQRAPFTVSDITFYLGRKYELPRERLTFTISHLHVYTRSNVHTLFEQIAGGGGIWPELFDS
ncbi:MAG TPA: hypothetical protein VIH60_01015 [Steroidobacteraceae bacterium]|jgi:hypothetical protein